MEFNDFKNDFFLITDDDWVERFLLHLGVRERLEFPDRPNAKFIAYSVDDHESHWLLFIRIRGFLDPKENGFMCRGLPKSEYSEVDAMTQFKLEVNRFTQGDIVDQKFWPREES